MILPYSPSSIPRATYRFQFHSQFTFKDAIKLVPYLHALGISHCYSSPLLVAKHGSTHCYDVIDHNRLNPDIGTLEEFEEFVSVLHAHSMGLILDIVPHHMFIGDASNVWWRDILENGQASIFSKHFDIDWHPTKPIFDNKVYLPILPEYYDQELKNQKIKIIYEKGTFAIQLSYVNLPTDPKSWINILKQLLSEMEKRNNESIKIIAELKNIIISLEKLPSTTELAVSQINERYKQMELIKKNLDVFFISNIDITNILFQQLEGFNKEVDALDEILNQQPYRLCYWKVANDEINYRRFFDIFEYASLRVEDFNVFMDAHHLIFKFIKQGLINGLRIDYVDGLWDPQKYLEDIREQSEFFYMIVEKILSGNEKLRPEWPVQGTVGYDFLNQLNGFFVSQLHKESILEIYKKFTNITHYAFESKYESKMLIANTSLASECHALIRRLNVIAQGHRSSQDYTHEALRIGLTDVLAWFPVYRSYIRAPQHQIHEEDRDYIVAAVKRSKRNNKIIDSSVYDFIQGVLLLEYPSDLKEVDKMEWDNFVMRFQQVTGPLMAKGLEDTAFYRFFPLASLNEVGSELGSYGINIDNLHKKNLERTEFWPYSMLSTMTHDAKRSPDIRARINVLSEIPEAWEQAIDDWSQLNSKHRVVNGEVIAPDRNEEYFLYQTLIGSWPLRIEDDFKSYRERIQGYMKKALYEAKLNTNRINPNKAHEQGVHAFIEKILDPEFSREFIVHFSNFFSKINEFGMLNSLSQTLIKLISPGLPDIYQGDEIWDYRLVDPDNRGLVDFVRRKQLLDQMKESSWDKYLQSPEDGQVKLFLIQKTLQYRKEKADLFAQGLYIPLNIRGEKADNLFAFARIFEKQICIMITGRLFTDFMDDFSHYKEGRSPWENMTIEIPTNWGKFCLKNVFTEEIFEEVVLKDVLKKMPFALLEGAFR